MTFRSLALVAFVVLLQLGGCATAGKPSTRGTADTERRHDEMIMRVGGGTM